MGMTEFTQAVAVILVVLVILFIVFRVVSRSSGMDRDKINEPGWTGAKQSYTGMDWNALRDDRVQRHLPNNKIAAIKAYRELTNAGLKEAKDAVEYYLAHPDEAKSRETSPPVVSGPVRHVPVPLGSVELRDSGLYEALAAGQFDEAVNIYKKAVGVDYFTARNAVEEIQRRGLAASAPPNIDAIPGQVLEEVQQLVRDGRKIDAIKQVREVTNLGLKEAKDIVEAIERKLKLS